MSTDRFHQAYLVRLWAVHHNEELLWRAALENIHTGERRAFADLPSLYRFLEAATAALATTAHDESGTSAAQHSEGL
ncbi:MAG: hypothetical protein DYG89_28865 [Caldilinea sp. CFX5]|nr:hypothetical protein [Caldilinea sp. CFX5]